MTTKELDRRIGAGVHHVDEAGTIVGPGYDGNAFYGCPLDNCQLCDAYGRGYEQGRWETLSALVFMVRAPEGHDSACCCEKCEVFALARNGKLAEARDRAHALAVKAARRAAAERESRKATRGPPPSGRVATKS